MKITEAERVRELEILVHTLEQELSTLKEKKENFQSQLTVVTGSSSKADLLEQFPCYEYCGRRPRKKFRDLPIEQVCNLVQQFEVATKSVRDQNALDSKCITELKNYIREQEQGEITWRKKINDLKDKTGVDLAHCTTSQREHLLSLQSFESEAFMEEAAARRKLLRKEIQAASTLVKAKGKTILIGKEKTESVEALQCEIKQLINDVRVVRRDIEVETNALEDERVLESDVQSSLEEKKNVENNNRMLIEQVEQLVQSLTEEREVMRLEKYAPQERLLKAQDYRLRQLEKRRKATEICLRHHCSIRAVNAILESKWEAAPVETLDGRDDLLDVDRVIPEDEKIHPALHNLFLREKERLAQAICKMNIVVAEKESVMASQACKLEALSRACNHSIQELDDTANKTAFEQEDLRREAQEWAHQQRLFYYELVREKNTLSASN